MEPVKINLTFTQCKQIQANTGDLRGFIEAVQDQPEFIRSMQDIDEVSELQAILQGGCASGAYMPAVTYFSALECMNEHYEEIEEILNDYCDQYVFDPQSQSWASFATELVSAAVEIWVMQFADTLDGVDWD